MSISVANEAHDGATWTTIVDEGVVTLANTETPILLFRNPTASGIKALITHLNFDRDSTVTISKFKTYGAPIVTGIGTLLTPESMLVDTGLPAGKILVYKFPTVSSNGKLRARKRMLSGAGSEGQNRFLWVAPNHDVLITVVNNVASVKTTAQIYWLEE